MFGSGSDPDPDPGRTGTVPPYRYPYPRTGTWYATKVAYHCDLAVKFEGTNFICINSSLHMYKSCTIPVLTTSAGVPDEPVHAAIGSLEAALVSPAALIWSKMSTGLPIEIRSSLKGQNYVSFCRLDIDIHRKNITVRFARRTDVMPPVPSETKHHPSAVDLLLIKRLIAETSKQNLLQFLQHEFVNISKSHADRLIGEMGPDFSPKMSVKSLTSQQIVRMHQLFRQAKFDDPSGDISLTLRPEHELSRA
ncbi:DNA topoisomerase 6 subunit B [Nymphaea thermarum]|nr:DNA topoisomerase 6 subunit B [Nymphaea thermarum]